MNMRICHRLLLALLPFLLLQSAPAQTETTQPADTSATAEPLASSVDPQEVRGLVERLQKIEQQLQRIKGRKPQPPAAGGERKVFALVEAPYLGAWNYSGTNGMRYFAGRLVFVNLSDKPVEVTREHVRLEADGDVYKLDKEVPEQIRGYSYQVNNQSVRLSEMQTPEKLSIPAGGTNTMPVVFGNLPVASHVPKMVLKVEAGDTSQELNINDQAMAELALDVQRIGPSGCLALLTISGTMNTINIGGLVETLEQMATDKVARAVIRWSDSAAPLNNDVQNWIQQSVYQARRGFANRNSQYPMFPATIRELHLAQLPKNSGGGRVYYDPYGSRTAPKFHNTDVDAVAEALRTAYEILPRGQLVDQIEHGHRLARAAALGIGGGRLSSDQLPIVLKYVDSEDPLFQRAALLALRHFGQPEAIDTLLRFVRHGEKSLNEAAVESLAASRYTAAHEALLSVLRKEQDADRKRIVQVLAKFPRPIWSETIYEFVQDPETDLGIEGIQALVQVGHPKLYDVLRDALQKGDENWKNQVFSVLVNRPDRESEELALEYTLNYLKTSPPTSQMGSLISRTKDRRALPLLLKHFEKGNGSRSTLINTLAQVGDESIDTVFLEKYDEMQDHEKTAVLNAMRQIHSPHFRELAGKALMSKDSSLIRTAVSGLQDDADDEAVKLLIEAYETSEERYAWSYIGNALGMLATPEARAALKKAVESDNSSKRSYASNDLRNARRRSPGYNFVYQGQSLVRQKKWKEAAKQFTLAIQMDDDLAEAYTGRGSSLLNQDKPKEARKDFEKAIKLDPQISEAVSGLAITLVRTGEVEKGLKSIEDNRQNFNGNNLYAYNAACVYSRAYETLTKQKDLTEEQIKQRDEYKKKALADLKQAVQWGFRDLDWMKKDPDLQPLADLKDFKAIHSPNGEKKDADKEEKPAEGGDAAATEVDVQVILD